jgi:hypothetical protein
VVAVELIPGRPAQFWWILARISQVITVAGIAIATWLLVVGAGTSITTLLIGFPAVALSMVASLKAFSVDKKETAAGYTTVPRSKDDKVALVDPQSGRVLREIGQPMLSRREYAIALANSRALTS